jgi:hypothetical protein
MVRRSVGLLLITALSFSGLLVLAASTSSAGASAPALTWTHVVDTPTGCQGNCTSSPPGGPGASMAYDPATNQLVLFASGGGNSTWVWNGTTWAQLDDSGDPGCTTTCTNSPPNKTTFGMAYDPASRAIVIFGSNGYNDTWAWNGTTWTQVADGGSPGCTTACPHSPPGSYGTQMAYDDATGQMVDFGGGADYTNSPPALNFNDTWILSYRNGTYSWAQVDDSGSSGCTITCPNAPPGRNVAQMTYDPATKQLVLWGGEVNAGQANGTNATWLWNGTTWNQVDDAGGAAAGCGETWPILHSCPSSPPGRVGHGMAYDPALGEVVVFGGMNLFNAQEYNDTWGWNGTAWTQLDADPGCGDKYLPCTGSPPARDTLAMADDAGSNQLVMFGGPGFNDTWVAPAAPKPTPPPASVQSGGAAIAATPGGQGYWVVAPSGAISAYGNAKNDGSMAGKQLNAPIVGIASTPDGGGYWLVASDGGIFSFGDASFHGSMGGVHLNEPIVGVSANPGGAGYWLVASDGGVFSFGEASFHGSMGGVHLNEPIVGMSANPGGAGYWLVASDGGVFSFGDSSFHGSMGGVHLNEPVVGLASSHDGGGYWLVASDGGVFSFGDTKFAGSAVGKAGASDTVGLFDSNGTGYTVVVSSGASYGFGDR